jgi:hypothetical protein
MNNDYLWDGTGEPDAEVQELEEVLSSLRYQPRPLVLPADIQLAPRRRYFPVLAAAAAIALVALVLGVWLRMQREQISPPDKAVAGISHSEKDKPDSMPSPTTSEPVNGASSPSAKVESSKPAGPHVPRSRTIGPTRQLAQKNPRLQREQMSAAERKEAEAAKDQLMLALRVVSAKLNLAQRKTVPATNNIRYQHKVG